MLIGIGATCKKPRICFDVITYNFINNEARAIPNKDSTKVGDTLWIEMNTPLVLQDVQTHIMVDYSKATTLGNTFQFLSFKGGSVDDPGVAYAADSFDIQMVNGHQETTTFPIENKAFVFTKLSDKFDLKVGIIPKSAGIFAIAISDAVGIPDNNGGCTKSSFTFHFVNTDQHLHYYQENRPGYVMSQYEADLMYFREIPE